MIREGLVVVALLAGSGCGGDDERAAVTGETEAARTTSPATTAAPDPSPEPARSVRGCARLWNDDALPPGSYQVTANEFIARVAPVRVRVAYERGNCFVVWPVGGGRVAISAAQDGRRPFGNPDQRRLKPGERVRYNARGDREGLVELDR